MGVIIGISGRFFEAPFLRARGFLLVSEGLYHIFFITGEERVGKTCFLLTKVIGSTIPPSPPPSSHNLHIQQTFSTMKTGRGRTTIIITCEQPLLESFKMHLVFLCYRYPTIIRTATSLQTHMIRKRTLEPGSARAKEGRLLGQGGVRGFLLEVGWVGGLKISAGGFLGPDEL